MLLLILILFLSIILYFVFNTIIYSRKISNKNKVIKIPKITYKPIDSSIDKSNLFLLGFDKFKLF